MRVLTAAAVLALLAACSKHGPQTNGQLHFKAAAHTRDTSSSSPTVCGQFTLQPFSLDQSGNASVAGAPVSIASNALGQTDAILGCIDSTNVVGPDWGYLVTATNFVDCSTGQPIDGLSPAVVSETVTVDCQKGVDVELPVTVNVSIAAASDTGYIDISVGVASSTVQTGCKQADYAGSMLHFGQSQLNNDSTIPLGIVGLDSSPAASAVSQYAGVVGKSYPTPPLDTFYTGQLDPTATATNLIYQTFAAPGCKGEYQDTNHAQCLTRPRFENGPRTTATLANVFVNSAAGFASASLNGPGSLTLISNVTDVTLNASVALPSPGFNAATAVTTVSAPAGSSFTGLFIDQTQGSSFWVTGTDATLGPVYARLAAPTWALEPWATITSLQLSEASCMGLFAVPDKSCFTPSAACMPTKKIVLHRGVNFLQFSGAQPKTFDTIRTEFASTAPAGFPPSLILDIWSSSNLGLQIGYDEGSGVARNYNLPVPYPVASIVPATTQYITVNITNPGILSDNDFALTDNLTTVPFAFYGKVSIDAGKILPGPNDKVLIKQDSLGAPFAIIGQAPVDAAGNYFTYVNKSDMPAFTQLSYFYRQNDDPATDQDLNTVTYAPQGQGAAIGQPLSVLAGPMLSAGVNYLQYTGATPLPRGMLAREFHSTASPSNPSKVQDIFFGSAALAWQVAWDEGCPNYFNGLQCPTWPAQALDTSALSYAAITTSGPMLLADPDVHLVTLTGAPLPTPIYGQVWINGGTTQPTSGDMILAEIIGPETNTVVGSSAIEATRSFVIQADRTAAPPGTKIDYFYRQAGADPSNDLPLSGGPGADNLSSTIPASEGQGIPVFLVVHLK